MRTKRWQEWVIVLSVIGLAGAGVWTIWGGDLQRLFRPGETPAATPEPVVTPPAGPAAGPF